MLCVFDFDGTLANTRTPYYQALEAYADENGFSLPSQYEIDLAFGNPNPPLFPGWGTEETFMQHLRNVYSLVDNILCCNPEQAPFYEGIPELLQDLKDQGMHLSVVTSRKLNPLVSVLRYEKLDSFFVTIRSSEDMIKYGYKGKPHSDKLDSVLSELNCDSKQAFMIGDTLMDMKMAYNAGVMAIGVAWGFHDNQTLSDHGANEIATSVKYLKEILLGQS